MIYSKIKYNIAKNRFFVIVYDIYAKYEKNSIRNYKSIKVLIHSVKKNPVL